jgi:hypothetical protein
MEFTDVPKPNHCDFCSKDFNRAQDLEEHIKSHAEVMVHLRSPDVKHNEKEPAFAKSGQDNDEASKAAEQPASQYQTFTSPRLRKRTKTGCLTCRKRRLKCGEERPACKNCFSSKRHCEGYNQRTIFQSPINDWPSASVLPGTNLAAQYGNRPFQFDASSTQNEYSPDHQVQDHPEPSITGEAEAQVIARPSPKFFSPTPESLSRIPTPEGTYLSPLTSFALEGQEHTDKVFQFSSANTAGLSDLGTDMADDHVPTLRRRGTVHSVTNIIGRLLKSPPTRVQTRSGLACTNCQRTKDWVLHTHPFPFSYATANLFCYSAMEEPLVEPASNTNRPSLASCMNPDLTICPVQTQQVGHPPLHRMMFRGTT